MKNTVFLPAIALRGLVVFPSMVLHFDVGRERSANALKAAAESDGRIFLVAQKDASVSEPTLSDIYTVGVIAEIRQLLTTPDGSTRVLVEGISRAKRVKSVSKKEYLAFEVKELPTNASKLAESTKSAMTRSLLKVFENYSMFTPRMPRELYEQIIGETDCEALFEKIVFNVNLRLDDKQMLLETNSLSHRVKLLMTMLTEEIEILKTELSIEQQVHERIEKNQREYYLREQLKVISKELGDGENPTEEADTYTEKIKALGLPEESEE